MGKANCLRGGDGAQAPQDVADVNPDRGRPDSQPRGDLRSRQRFGQQSQHLALPGGQAHRSAQVEPVKEDGGCGAGEQIPCLFGGGDGLQEQVCLATFVHHASRAGAQGLGYTFQAESANDGDEPQVGTRLSEGA